MSSKFYFFIFFILGTLNCKAQKTNIIYKSSTLKIEQLSPNSYVHISYLETQDYGKVSCNGMVIIDNGEALIFDTPIQNKVSDELIRWIENTLKCKPIGIVTTHFHEDCLGGLASFHKKNIPSYASYSTIELATKNGYTIPENGFKNFLELTIGNSKVINEFFGEGHTIDNIVSYFPKDKILFGGCLIKAIGAKKGNLQDANTNSWSNTVNAIKSKYKNVEIIIPGHGKTGGQHLLDYTIKLFKTE